MAVLIYILVWVSLKSLPETKLVCRQFIGEYTPRRQVWGTVGVNREERNATTRMPYQDGQRCSISWKLWRSLSKYVVELST